MVKIGFSNIYYFLGTVISGTAALFALKLQTDTTSLGQESALKFFHKPLFQAFLMSVGASFLFLIIGVYYLGRFLKKESGEKEKSLLVNNGPARHLNMSRFMTKKSFFLLVIPAIFDLSSYALLMAGLLHLYLSVGLLLRYGCKCVFSSLVRVLLSKRRLLLHHWVGLTLSILSLAIVVAYALTEARPSSLPPASTIERLLACLMVIFAQLMQTSAAALEDTVLRNEERDTPLMIVAATQGVWGALMMACLGFPLAYVIPGSDPGPSSAGSLENEWDTLVMLSNCVTLVILLCVVVVISLTFCLFGLGAMQRLGARGLPILQAFQCLLAWGCGLFLYYTISDSYGEPWSDLCYLELLGFLLILVSQCIYHGLLQFPGVAYDDHRLLITPPPLMISPIRPSALDAEEEDEPHSLHSSQSTPALYTHSFDSDDDLESSNLYK